MVKKNNRAKTWIDEPKMLTSIKYDNNYYLYIDESGNHNNSHLKKIREYMEDPTAEYVKNQGDEVFVLTGVLIRGKELGLLEQKVKSLKRKWFGKTSSGRKPIVIHKKDFGKKNPFRQGENFDKKKFELEYEKIIKSTDLKVFSICMNKVVLYCDGELDCASINKDHKLYINAIDKLFSQVSTYANITRKKIIPVFESMSQKDDRKIHNHITSNLERYQFVKSLYFSNKTINNSQVVVGLEVADYFSHSSFRWGLCRDYHRIITKYNNYPSHYGNGMFMIK